MDLTAGMQNALATGLVAPRWAVLLWARHRDTNATERIGFWSGDDVRSVSFDGLAWTLYPGALLDISAPVFASGLDIRTQRATLFSDDAAAVEALRIYDPRLCHAELWLVLQEPSGHEIVGTSCAFRGTVDAAPISEDADGATCELSMVSALQAGTGHGSAKKSEASQKARLSTDTGRDYSSITKAVPVIWGVETKEKVVVRRPGTR